MRLPWLFAPAVFSDDVYRYVWEGRVWAAGLNPFAYGPADPALAALHDTALHASNAAIWAQVNHPELSSIYPPVAQGLFVVLAPGGVLAWKLLAAAADVGTVALLTRGAWAGAGRSGWLWALLPLPALESAGSGHLEAVGVFCMVGALTSAQPGLKPAASSSWAILFAWVGAMIKLLPAATLLPLLRTRRACVLVVGATLIASLPILAAGPHLIAGFEAYRQHWTFNGSAYPLLAWAFERVPVDVLDLASEDPARSLLQVVGAGVVAGSAWRLRRRPPAEMAAGLSMVTTAAFVLLSPTVHPWYVLWPLAAALATRAQLVALPWVLAGVLAPFAYRVLGTLHDGVWQEQAGTRWVVWLPVWLALGVVSCRSRPPVE